MNKLSKVLVFLFILFSFIACFKKPHSRSYTYYIINETDNMVYIKANFDDEETRSIYLQGKTDEPVLLLSKGGFVPHCLFCPYPQYFPEIRFYNIADTSSVNFWDLYSLLLGEDEQLLKNIYKTEGECKETKRDIDNEYIYECIHITDEFLDLFEKDYSMLDKFTEYYP